MAGLRWQTSKAPTCSNLGFLRPVNYSMKSTATFPLDLAPREHSVAALHTEIVSEFEELLTIIEDCIRFGNTMPASIFQSPGWLRAWWKAFGTSSHVCAPVVRDSNGVVGILPLVRRGSAMGFVGMPGSDYGDILCCPELAPEVVAEALRSLLRYPGWSSCRFNNLRLTSQLVHCITDLPPDIRSHLSLLPVARRSALVLNEGRDDVTAAALRKPALKRRRNKLYRTGEVCFRHLETRPEARQLLPTLFQQHTTRRAFAGERSQFLAKEWREFYTALVDELDLQSQLRFSVLEFNHRPIACHLGFEYKGSLILYKPTFDVDYWELSPGDVMLSELLTYARERELNEVDFTIGREAYKEHFTNQSENMFCLTLDHLVVNASLRRLFEPVYVTSSRGVRKLGSWIVGGVRFAETQRNRRLSLLSHWRRPPLQSCGNEPGVASDESSQVVPPQQLRLSDLAQIALRSPYLFRPKVLQDFRTRIRNGECCYVWGGPDHQQIGWIRRVKLPPDKPSSTPSTKREADMLYDLRPVSGGHEAAVDIGLVQWFAGRTLAQGVWADICILARDHASRDVLESAGFLREDGFYRTFRRRIWHI